MSLTGLLLETQSLRIGELHVYDSADMVTPTQIDIEIALPRGVVRFTSEAIRYDQVAPSTYVVGLKIIEISDADRRAYEELVKGL